MKMVESTSRFFKKWKKETAQEEKKKLYWNHLQISGSFRPVFLLPGQESSRRSLKGPGETF